MLLSENLLGSLIEQLRVTDILGSIPFQWNKTNKCFKLKSPGKLLIYKRRIWIGALFTFLIFLQIAWTWKTINIFVKLHCVFNFLALLMHIYTHHVFCSKADLIVSFLNQMISFEKRKNGKYSNK